jgi:hypothetical protein
MPQLDMVLWVLKADDRAYAVEEQFYQDVFAQYSGPLPPVLWVLNQVDKTEPAEQWNWPSAQPSALQAERIAQKQQAVARQLGIAEQDILPVSVRGRYRLSRLVEAMITRLPKQARSPLVPHLQNGYRTEAVISTASSSFGDAVVEVIDKIIDLAPLPQVARTALQAVTHRRPGSPFSLGIFLRLINRSNAFVVVDMFLFNDDRFCRSTRSIYSLSPINQAIHSLRSAHYVILPIKNQCDESQELSHLKENYENAYTAALMLLSVLSSFARLLKMTSLRSIFRRF